MRTIAAISGAGAPSSSPAMTQPPSPWHSPVPYLFGGLAAMLGLIAFALLVLACSYWRLSDDTDNNLKSGSDKGAADKVYEEKILVIMAGHDAPTFLATPVVSTKAFSIVLADENCVHTNDAHKTECHDR